MCLFSALSALNESYLFHKDRLCVFMEICKKNNQFSELLEDIQIKNNGVFGYSNDLDEAIAKLKWARLYTVSPEIDDTIQICKDIPVSGLIQKRNKYFEKMSIFFNQFGYYGAQLEAKSNQKSIVK